jgi:hypothetical protein
MQNKLLVLERIVFVKEYTKCSRKYSHTAAKFGMNGESA